MIWLWQFLNTSCYCSVAKLCPTFVTPWTAAHQASLSFTISRSLLKVRSTGLKLSIQKTKVVASGPSTSWQIDGETMETVTDFIFLDSKLTADGDCSHEIKRRLFLGRKAMKTLDSILKSRDVTLPIKVYIVKAVVSPVVTYGGESWTVKKAECQRIDAFELRCWRRLFESPLDSKEIKPDNPEGHQPWIFTERTYAEAEAPVLWLPDMKSQLTGRTLMLGKIEGRRRRGRQ